MRIPIGYINALMSDTIRDSHSGETHVNQQTDMAMSDSMNPYSFYSAGGAATANFVVKVRFREREYTVIFVDL